MDKRRVSRSVAILVLVVVIVVALLSSTTAALAASPKGSKAPPRATPPVKVKLPEVQLNGVFWD